jgi:hypothetical protein
MAELKILYLPIRNNPAVSYRCKSQVAPIPLPLVKNIFKNRALHVQPLNLARPIKPDTIKRNLIQKTWLPDSRR